jgi:hypothetical protein
MYTYKKLRHLFNNMSKTKTTTALPLFSPPQPTPQTEEAVGLSPLIDTSSVVLLTTDLRGTPPLYTNTRCSASPLELLLAI